ncbi:MAG: metallophosphoesterase [Acidobacteriaceae bacterium]|nr:metallophosphoesterase [Acidobacteriaceae bacterium]MBV9500488.1 metallophosphoesterase [Acidobacteriaceae bacterium]
MANVVEERSLTERLKPRIAIERQFEALGHTFRHGALHAWYEHHVLRPGLRMALRCAGVYSRGVRNALNPVVREITLEFENLPAAFDGFRILQISDFHIDGVDGLAEALVPVLKNVRPDACVLTGDYRFEDSGPCDAVYSRMRTILPSIEAQEGIYGILGNHDSADIAHALEEMGVRMLVNDSVEITRAAQSLALIGVDDPFDYGCDDLPGALFGVDAAAFKVLLAHVPELYEQAAASGIDLYLCGHTHGGQIRFPLVGSIRNNARCPRAYAYGLWRHGAMRGYTSSGVGCSSLPIRFNCPPEVAMIELHRAERRLD